MEMMTLLLVGALVLQGVVFSGTVIFLGKMLTTLSREGMRALESVSGSVNARLEPQTEGGFNNPEVEQVSEEEYIRLRDKMKGEYPELADVIDGIDRSIKARVVPEISSNDAYSRIAPLGEGVRVG